MTRPESWSSCSCGRSARWGSNWALITAEVSQIPFQVRQPGGGGTNTAAFQRMHGGIPAATIATPARYIHAPASMIHLQDFQHVVALAEATLRSLSDGFLEATQTQA